MLNITTLAETRRDEVRSALESADGQAHFVPQFGDCLATAVLELNSLELIPDALIRIQLRCVARQPLQMQPCRRPTGQVVLDRFPMVNRCPIPDHQELAANLPLELTQKGHDRWATVRLVLDVGEQSPVWRHGADDREVVVRERGTENRRLATRRIRARYEWKWVEAGFVDTDDRAAFGCGFA